MSTATTNLGLTKPAGSEQYSVAVVNTNNDLIDAAVGPQAGSLGAITVASTNGEVVIATYSLPANAGLHRVYEVVALAVAGVTGTPTLTLRCRVGGLAGALLGSLVVTAASGVTGKSVRAKGTGIIAVTGTAGTWMGALEVIDELNTVLPSAADVNVITTPVAKDTTAAQDLVLTAQWSAASASNTITSYAQYGSRVA